MVNTVDDEGSVITFYSYKGGTGRSMLLANIAWILASNGNRVIAVDWDLEGPGLHRYFSPFLPDKEMTDTDGVIDFVLDFSVAAATASDCGEDKPEWYASYADITRYATRLLWDFPRGGRLDFVGAGRQGPSYSSRVTGFQWEGFYESFGGSAFIDEARRVMKQRYDYVLIDSRTGVSDTSGICTVQLPDVLIVCFTLNNQSIEGASAAAHSIQAQRNNSLLLLPVPTRIENAEKDKRDLRRMNAMSRFGPLLQGTSERERMAYWDDVSVLYEPFYAYEEVLAAFRDEPGSPYTMLGSVERLTKWMTGERLEAVRVNPRERALILAAYEGSTPSQGEGPPAAGKGSVYIAYRRQNIGAVRHLFDQLSASLGSDRVVIDSGILPGDDFLRSIQEAIEAADVVLAVIGPNWARTDPDDFVNIELTSALAAGRRVVPVLIEGAQMPMPSELPSSLEGLITRQAAVLSDSRWNYDVERLLAAIEVATARQSDFYPLAEDSSASMLAPSAASDAVIERVLQTRRINYIAIGAAVVSVAISVVLILVSLLGHL